MSLSTLKEKGQITLPSSIRKQNADNDIVCLKKIEPIALAFSLAYTTILKC